jgi:hypothetical protein
MSKSKTEGFNPHFCWSNPELGWLNRFHPLVFRPMANPGYHPKLVPDTSVAQFQAHGILGLVHGSQRSWTQLIQRLKNGTVHHEFLHVSTI